MTSLLIITAVVVIYAACRLSYEAGKIAGFDNGWRKAKEGE